MHIFATWLLFASIHLAATMSPGPAFAMTVRTAIAYDRRAAVLMAGGLGFGLGLLGAIVLGGFSVLIAQSILAYTIFKYAGAAYLLYIGTKAIFSKKKNIEAEAETPLQPTQKIISRWAVFRLGFLTNALNPKAMVFLSAVFPQFIGPETPPQIIVIYLLTSIIIETAWFAGVSFVLTDSRIKQRFMGFAHWIERVCGGLLIGLGIRLALSKG